MARIRTVKPELFRHELLFKLENETKLPIRLAWIGLFTICDREGRFKWRPNTIKLDVLPWDNVDFETILNAMLQVGLIQKYKTPESTEEYGCIPSFLLHQTINNKESPSRLPAPLNGEKLNLGQESLYLEKGELEKGEAELDSGEVEMNLGKGFLEQGNGEREGRVSHASTKSKNKRAGIRTEYPDTFEDLWFDFEMRGEKKAAFESFQSLNLSPEEVLDLAKAIKALKARGNDWAYRKHFERFLKTDWREWIGKPPLPIFQNVGYPKTKDDIRREKSNSEIKKALQEAEETERASIDQAFL